MFGSVNQQKCEVKYFVMVQTGTYKEQFIRPFNVKATSQNVLDLEEATRGGMNLGVSAVQEIASSIVAPAANTEGVTAIENGWDSRRFRFIMVVEETHPFIGSSNTQRVFFGYTDHCDASFNHLDPNMRIYFNSETVIANNIEQTPMGPVMKSHLVGANQIISPVDVTAGPTNIYQSASTHLIRPEDIFNLGQTEAVAQKLHSTGIINGPIDQSIDYRTLTGKGADYKYSRREDSSPVRFLSGTLSAYQHAVKEADADHLDGFNGTGFETLLGEASSHSCNQKLSSNAFLSILRERCGYMENGYVTLADLQQCYPETSYDSVTKYSMDNGQSIRKISYAEHSEVWGGADNLSIAASLIGQTVPSVMMDTLFRSISFSVTNGSGPNQYHIDINPNMTKTMVTVARDMIQGNIIEFERRLKTDILNIISRGNQIPFRMVVSSDLAGETIIDISVGSENLTRFIAPTFSDALSAPVITRDMNLVKAISSDMIYLVKSVINPQVNLTGQQYNPNMFTTYEHPQTPIVNPNINQGNNYVDLGLL